MYLKKFLYAHYFICAMVILQFTTNISAWEGKQVLQYSNPPRNTSNL